MEDAHPIRRYFSDLRGLLTRPTEFFSSTPIVGMGVARPLLFAIITHWLGTAVDYLWKSAIGTVFHDWTQDALRVMDKLQAIDSTDRAQLVGEVRDKAFHWILGAGSVLLDPFKAVLQLLFVSFFTWIGVRLLVDAEPFDDRRERLSFETVLSILCFAMAPSILQGIPVMGTLVSSLFCFVVAVIGMRAVYRVSTGRGIVITLFPKLLFWGLIFSAVAVFGFFLLKLALNFLHTL